MQDFKINRLFSFVLARLPELETLQNSKMKFLNARNHVIIAVTNKIGKTFEIVDNLNFFKLVFFIKGFKRYETKKGLIF